MLTPAEKALGKLAIRRGLVTAEQVELCSVDLLRRPGGRKPLGLALQERGLLSDPERAELERAAAAETAAAAPGDPAEAADEAPRAEESLDLALRRAAESPPRGVRGAAPPISPFLSDEALPPGRDGATRQEEDLALAKVAIERGLITLDEVRECIQAQTDFRAIGRAIPLGQLLIRRRSIDVETFVDLAREVRSRQVRCPSCGTLSLVPRPEDVPRGASEGRCAKCGGPLPLFVEAKPAEPPAPPVPEPPARPSQEGRVSPIPSTPVFGQQFVAGAGAGVLGSSEDSGPTPVVPRPAVPGLPPISGPVPALGETEKRAPGAAPVPARSQARADSLSGRRFGRYDVISEIARGGMGVVYRAQDPRLGRVVALKVLKDGVAASEKQVRRFKRETEAVAKLHHPNIVAVHDVGCEDGRHFFTMDYIEGEPLDEKIRRGPIDPPEALLIAEQIARAIHHAHEQGVIHRDLKPANVLLDKRGVPKITDFGLAKNVDHLSAMTKTGAAVGTPFYMPPEQARGDAKRIDRRVDVYAIGVLLFEMLTGDLPFDGETTVEVYNKILSDDAPRPSAINARVDAEIDGIVGKAMAKERDDRYPTALALAEDIRRKLEGKAVQGRAPSALRVAARRARRAGPMIAAAAGGVLLLGLAVTTVWVLNRRHAEELEQAAVKTDLERFRERVREAGDEADALRQRALGAAGDGRLKEARGFIDEAERLIASPDGWIAELHFREQNEARARALVAEFQSSRQKPLLRDLSLARARVLGAAPDGAEDETERAYERALAIDPQSIDAHMEKARFLIARAKYEQAVDELGRVLDLRPGDLEALFQRGLAYEAMRMFARAAEEYRALEARERAGGARFVTPSGEPTRLASAILRTAACEAGLGHLDAALALVKQLTDADPQNFPAYVLGTEVRLARGDAAGAQKDANAAIDLKPSRPEGYFARGKLELALGEDDRARVDFDTALERDPKFQQARVLRAMAFDRRGDAARAKKEYEAIAEAGGAPPAVRAQAWLRLAEMRRAGAQAPPRPALEAYDAAIGLDARLAAARVARARAHVRAGDLDGAEKDLARARELGADAAAVENAGGLLLLARGKAEEAAARFQKALDAAPAGFFPEAAANLGAAKSALGLREDARQAYLRALELEAQAGDADLAQVFADATTRSGAGPASVGAPEIAVLLADPGGGAARPDAEAALFFRLGIRARDESQASPSRGDDAIAAFLRASAIAPGFARAHLERARVRRQKGAIDEALEDARAAVEANPLFADALLLRGDLRLRQAAKAVEADANALAKKAREDFEAAIALEPERFDGHLGLARALERARDLAGAEDELDRTIERAIRGASAEDASQDVSLLAEAYDLRAGVRRARGDEAPARSDEQRAQDLRRGKHAVAAKAYQEGQAFAGEGRWSDARERYGAAIEADPTFAAAWYERGQANFQLLEPLSAALDVSRALELDPKYADPVFSQTIHQADASGLEMNGLFLQVEDLLKSSPDNVPALFLRSLYRVIRLFVNQASKGDEERGLADLDRVLRLSPRHAFAHVCRAYIRQRRGDVQGAHEDVALAEKLDDKSSLGPFVAAVIAAREGDAGAAARALERAIDRGFSGMERIEEEKAFARVADDARWKAAVKRIAPQ
jgi:tetratricopeptide (TPR) repeat protein